MIKNFISNLKRYKVSSLLNILGMSVAFASAYVLFLWGVNELTYNSTLRDADSTFRLQFGKYPTAGPESPFERTAFVTANLAHRFASANEDILEGFGKMERYIGTSPLPIRVPVGEREDTITIQENWGYAAMPKVMGFNIIDGNVDDLEIHNNIILCESFARAHGFWVGDVIYDVYQRRSLTVCAIFEDFPDNCWFTGLQSYIADPPTQKLINDNVNGNYNYFYRLKDKKLKEAFIENCYNSLMQQEGMEISLDSLKKEVPIELCPLSEAAFDTDTNSLGLVIDKNLSYTQLIIVAAILLIAFVNYFNFFMAMLPGRVRRMNVEKVFGAPLWLLRLRLLFESLGIVTIALLLAALIIVFVAPEINYDEIMRRPIYLSENLPTVLKFVILALLMAVVTSIYPIYYLTSVSAAFAVKKSFGNTVAGHRLRYALLSVQFFITLVLIIVTMFIKHQTNYMVNYDMGFDKENVHVVYVNTKHLEFESILKQSLLVEDVAFAYDGYIIRDYRMGWGRHVKGRGEGESISFQVMPVSYSFLRMLGIEIVEGRDFVLEDEYGGGAYIFNEKARDAYNLKVGDVVGAWNGDAPIVGFCKDFNFRPLSMNTVPFAFIVMGTKQPASYCPYIKAAPGVPVEEFYAYVRECFAQLTGKSVEDEAIKRLEFEALSHQIATAYQSEEGFAFVVGIFSLISIALSLMGVFGLVFFETQYRRREIALRKVHGASVNDILLMFVWQYVKIVLASFAVALPVGYIIVSGWLQGFAYPVPIKPWIFIFALVAVAAVTSVIVLVRAYGVANDNPINSLYAE